MQSHDDYVINGYWHRCICGERFSDSDGGPCHSECSTKGCEGIAGEGEDFCPDCIVEIERKDHINEITEIVKDCPLFWYMQDKGLIDEIIIEVEVELMYINWRKDENTMSTLR
jgi:hypothetical protein